MRFAGRRSFTAVLVVQVDVAVVEWVFSSFALKIVEIEVSHVVLTSPAFSPPYFNDASTPPEIPHNTVSVIVSSCVSTLPTVTSGLTPKSVRRIKHTALQNEMTYGSD